MASKRLVILINALVNGSMFLSFFYVPQLAGVMEMDARDLSILTTFAAVTTLITNYWAGWMSDHWGRHSFIRFGFALNAIAFLMYYRATSIPDLIFARMLMALAWGLFNGVFIAYVSDSGMGMGRYTAFASLGATIFLLLCKPVSAAFGMRMVFQIGFIANGVALVCALWLPKHRMQNLSRVFWPKHLLVRNARIYLGAFLRHSGAASMWVLWTYYLNALGADEGDIGLINSVNTLTQFVFAFWLLDRMKHSNALQWGMFLSMACFLSFVFVKNHTQLYPSQVILGASWSLFYAGSLKSIEERNPQEKGAALGMLGSVMQFAFVIGPAVSTWLIGDLKTEAKVTGAAGFTDAFSAAFIDRFHIIIYFATAMAAAAWILQFVKRGQSSSSIAQATPGPS